MKRITSFSLWLVGAALAFAALATPARANTLDIHVSINATKSLSALTTTYSFGALSLTTSSNSATAITIRNNSGAYVETYTLQGANATSDTGGTNWTLQSSTGTNQYRLDAAFSATSPIVSSGTWTSNYLTSSPQACSITQFGDGVIGDAGTNVSPVAGVYDRSLWFRITTPDISTGTEARTAQVTIAVQ